MLYGKSQLFYYTYTELRLLLLTLDLKSEQLLIGYKLSNKILKALVVKNSVLHDFGFGKVSLAKQL